MNEQGLRDRIGLVTGSSRGIGLGVARAFAADGAQVVLHGRSEMDLRGRRGALPGDQEHSWIAADLGPRDGVLRMIEEMERRFSRLDILVHCAGILGPRVSLDRYPRPDWEAVLHLNLTVPFLLTQGLLPLLRKGNAPSVVFVSSGVGKRGVATWGGYSVSKVGLGAVAQIWAEELGSEGIRVNAVNPGGTRTDMRAQAFPEEDPSTLPTPEDIAPVFVWLARPDSTISGQVIDARTHSARDR